MGDVVEWGGALTGGRGKVIAVEYGAGQLDLLGEADHAVEVEWTFWSNPMGRLVTARRWLPADCVEPCYTPPAPSGSQPTGET